MIADVDYRVVAYMAMSATMIDGSKAPKALQAGSLGEIPAILCGRLAVDQEYRRLGLGTTLVRLLLSKAAEVNQIAACRAVVVHALDSEARAFWERYGFEPFTSDPEERDLYLLTKDIEATLSRLLH